MIACTESGVEAVRISFVVVVVVVVAQITITKITHPLEQFLSTSSNENNSHSSLEYFPVWQCLPWARPEGPEDKGSA